ncbi:hypothetical protein [Pseudostreptobacillus hongkongensis]|uniref:hypothetical protein n=1 Tax=Pseudostreptobacillus hongkongensis TaxID=1162717 RepID=UPI0008320465|nr:hypothetical protein [Pseudostreptobacillus hongkongensis]
MRKIKNKDVKKVNKKMLKTKPAVIKDDKDKHIALISIALFIIERQIANLFKFDEQFKILTTRNITKLVFKNYAICDDSFKKEFSLFRSFISLLHHVRNGVTEDILYKRIAYTKNAKADNVFKWLTEIELSLMVDIMKPYLETIETKSGLNITLNYINLLASFKVLSDTLSSTKNEELLDLYDRKYLKTLRTISTKMCNLIPSSLKELTGEDNISADYISDLLIKNNKNINNKVDKLIKRLKLNYK